MSTAMSVSADDLSENIYEYVQNNIIEQLDIGEDYVDMKTDQLTQDVLPVPSIHKLSKTEKTLLTVLVILSLILVTSTALSVAAYSENIRTVNKLNHLISQISIQNNKFALFMNETRIKLVNLENAAYRQQNYSSSLEKQTCDIQNQIYLDICQLNKSTCAYLGDVITNVTTEMEFLKNALETSTEATRTNKHHINILTTKLVSDMKYLHVFDSCSAVFNLSLPFPSGMYWVKSSENSTIQVNCMPSCNGNIGQWRRVAYLNTSDSNPGQCPGSLEMRSDPPSCRQKTFNAGCSSVKYQTGGTPYSQICGKIHARAAGSPDGFQHFGGNRKRKPTIEDNYVDGVSLTHGSNPRTHIWTFAASVNALGGECAVCDRQRLGFIETDYSCELIITQCPHDVVCNAGQLWEGGQCVGNATFYRQLPHFTSDDIEMRVCRGEDQYNEDILITFIEVFIIPYF